MSNIVYIPFEAAELARASSGQLPWSADPMDIAELRIALHNYHANLEPDRYKRVVFNQATDLESPDVKRCLHTPAGYFGIIAYDDMDPVGLASGFVVKALRARRTATLEELYVAPEFRSRGVGKELIRKFEGSCRVKGVQTIRVGVVSRNDRAIEFYKRCGLSTVELRMERNI